MTGFDPASDVALADPFDLPDWVGVEEVTWAATGPLVAPLVPGELRAGDAVLPCDVLACDVAHPSPVLEESWRTAAHLAWSLGEALLLSCEGRTTIAVPAWSVEVGTVLEAIRRLARAVGAPADRFTVALRL